MILSRESYMLLNELAEPLKEKLWNNTVTEPEWQIIKLLNAIDILVVTLDELQQATGTINRDAATLLNGEIAQLYSRRAAE